MDLRKTLTVLFAFLGVYTLSFAQESPVRISGTISDSEGNPIPGAAAIVKDSSPVIGTVTDENGHFWLEVPGSRSTVVISAMGYEDREFTVGGKINFEIELHEQATELTEVVVAAYGSQKRAAVVSAIETVEPAKLRTGTARSLSNNLAGNLAGIIAVTRSGEPGHDNSNFWIRGVSTFSGAQNPLVLVDGIERDLNNIDPAEIESFSILKDASATAMYGVRGANGIIIINTKRGKVGPPTVNFRMEQSVQQPTTFSKFIGAADYMELLNELKEDKSHLPYTQEQIERTRYHYDMDLYPDVDWMDTITKEYAYSSRANLSVSGGSDFLRYSLVASYFHEDGITERDHSLPYDTSIKLNRYNMRANVDLDITKTTLLRLNVGGFMQNRRAPNVSIDDAFSNAFATAPNVHPARYSDGTIPVVSFRVNPWATMTQSGYQTNIATQLQALIALEQNLRMITRGLKAKLTFSFDSYNESNRVRSASPTFYAPSTRRDVEGNLIHGEILSRGSESLGFSSSGSYGNKNIYLETQMTWDRTFGRHDLSALLLYNQQSYDPGAVQPYRKQGIAGRLSYLFDKRYVAEFNFGYNGSENFAPGKRFGFFPSFALGWRISDEPFMEDLRSTLTKLKLRASYGKVGNDNIGGRRFAYITTVYTGQAGWQWGEQHQYGFSGITEGDTGVDNLTWETAWKKNLGVEIGVWNALELQVDLFEEKRSNIFMQRKTVPTQTGYMTNTWANYGKMTNRGMDASLNFNKQFGSDWSVSARATFTYAKNRVDEYDEPDALKGTYRGLTGRSLGTQWGLQAMGLFTADDFNEDGTLKFGIPAHEVGTSTGVRPGDIRYKDMNGDGRVTDADEGYIGGTYDPQIVYGFGANVFWKQFDVAFFFQGVGQTYQIIGNSAYFLPGSGQGLQGNVYSNYQDRWTEDNPSQNVFWPRLSEQPNQHNYRPSTWWLADRSFLRLKTLEFGYSLPGKLCDAVYMKNVRFFVSGNNLFCLSGFKLWDPELNSSSGLRYPPMRSVMFGIDVTF